MADLFFYGVSIPPLDHGLHRIIRQTVFGTPRITPYFLIAWYPYSLQVGWNLQYPYGNFAFIGPWSGERVRWYSRIRNRSIFLGMVIIKRSNRIFLLSWEKKLNYALSFRVSAPESRNLLYDQYFLGKIPRLLRRLSRSEWHNTKKRAVELFWELIQYHEQYLYIPHQKA